MAATISDDEMLGEELNIKEEKALYENLKNYVNIINQSAVTEANNLSIAASGYELNRNSFVFVVYSRKKWQRFVAEGFAFTVEGKYSEIVSNNNGQTCTLSKTELTEGELYVYRYTIPLRHTRTIPLSMVNHCKVELLRH